MHDILEVLKSRRTTRSFTDEIIKEGELMILLEAGRYAPSGHNDQPWFFTVIQNYEMIKALNEKAKGTLNPQDEFVNNLLIKSNYDLFYGARTVIIVSYRDDAVSPIEGISAATQSISLQAEAMGIGTCWNGLVKKALGEVCKSELIKEYDIPNSYTPYFAIAVGYIKNKNISKIKRKEEYYKIIR
jgi:nitroreductase